MRNLLEKLANDLSVQRAFRRDPESVLAQFPELTAYERRLIKSGDSSAIEVYLSGRGTLAATTIINAVVIVVVKHGDIGLGEALAKNRDYWRDRLAVIARKFITVSPLAS